MRLAVPGLADLLLVDDGREIAEAADDARLDREYERRGPLMNRLILGRVRDVLALNGHPFPPVSPRADPERQRAQAANEEKFATLGGQVAPADVAALADYVRGDAPAHAIGPLAQGAVGRLFVPTYQADPASWRAAEVLGAAPSNFNPVRMLLWALTRRVHHARALLAERVGGDPTGMHATGVAIHNIVTAFERMRALYANKAERGLVSVDAAVERALVAPKQVLRQPTQAGGITAGSFGRDTLVLLRLEKANARQPGYRTAFMAGHWSRCPAREWVPALYAQVWRAAIAGGDA